MVKNNNLFWYLKNIDLFQGLDERGLRIVAGMVNEKECAKKELLYTPYRESNSIFILKKGEVTLYSSVNGKRVILEVLGPGSIFGKVTAEIQSPEHFAEVTVPSYVCSIPLERFPKLLEAYPKILLNLLTILSSRVQEYQEKVGEKFLSAEEKVINCLRNEERNHRSLLSKWLNTKTKMTHAKIAEKTGLSRETVSRIMSNLKKEGKL